MMVQIENRADSRGGDMRRKTGNAIETPITVTGPGCEGRKVPNVGCGIGLAQYLAGQRSTDGETWFVRDGDIVEARVKTQGKTIVTVTS
jgi:hypothetical protein